MGFTSPRDFSSPRVESKGKYELTDLADADQFDAAGGGTPIASQKSRRGSFAGYRDSPMVSKVRRKSMTVVVPSPRGGGGTSSASNSGSSKGDFRDFSPSPSQQPRAFGLNRQNSGLTRQNSQSMLRQSLEMGEQSPYSHIVDQSASSSSSAVARKSCIGGRRGSKSKRKVTFRNPVADYLMPDNSMAVSRVDGDLVGEDNSGEGFGTQINAARRRRRRQRDQSCCTIT